MTEVANDAVVDGRYKILNRIGSGGMADVYLAEDSHLGREVALKVLHRRFAQDSEFVERFRREASAAAGLQHPHVVGVFDRGEHEGTYYIAMEHLRGRTLKELIAEEAPLDQLRAVDLGVQILAAAGFAHRHGVIHRDFKPHNVIVDDEDHAKVTDFGIARAGASEMTETGSIMGTAQYLSPEQAQGHSVTATSDIYSIGVMLFEMLTGRLLFEGDSAVSIALKHLSEPPPTPSSIRPDLNLTLEQVVMGALAKDPRARWQKAEDFAEALEAARTHVEAGSNGGQDTAVFGALPAVAAAGAAAGAGETEPAEAAEAAEAPEAADAAESSAAAGPLAGDPAEASEASRQARRRQRLKWALGAMVAVLLAVTVYALTRPEKFEVPRVVGQQLAQARQTLDRRGFERVAVERERSQAAQDVVLKQEPDASDQAAKDDKVTLVVSSGPGENTVPSVRNLPKARAMKELKRAGFKVNVDDAASDSIRAGYAIRTSPPESQQVERGTPVRLFISTGPKQVSVPSVTGLLRATAESRLGNLGFEVQVATAESDKREDEVIFQSPVGGTSVEPGSGVTITVSTGKVSKGKEKVTVPDVTGMSQRGALSALRAEGLTGASRKRKVDAKGDDGQVVGQSPAGGAEVDKGRSVTIFIGEFKAPAHTSPTPAPKTKPQQ